MKSATESVTNSADSSPLRRQYIGVQYLRGLAALMVVAHHLRDPKDNFFNPLANYNGLAYGVQIFFVISGFIMFTAARSEHASQFITRRLIRVVPMYWLATIGFLALDLAMGHTFSEITSPSALAKSFLFIPYYNTVVPSEIWPYLIPGWTLNYEMFFYMLFAICIPFGRLRFHILIGGILALVALGIAINPHDALAKTYSSPLLALFAAGVLVGLVEKKGNLPKWIAYLWPMAVISIFFATSFVGTPFHYIPAVAVLICLVATDSEFSIPAMPLLKLLGDASYSIYLSHMVVVRMFGYLLGHLPFSGWMQFLIYMSVGLISAATFGIVVHVLVERKLLNFFRKHAWSRR